MYTLAIDASNIRGGGGVTHLVELLRNASPEDYGFSKVIIFSNEKTLRSIKDKKWLVKIHNEYLNGSLIKRTFWQRFYLKKSIQALDCDLLFTPGGMANSGFKPNVTMHRNLLPFEWNELVRYGFSMETLRLIILRFTQSASFKNSDGVIFLTNYAKEAALKVTGELKAKKVIIPHGIEKHFFNPPRKQRNLYTNNNEPIRIIYVSSVELYKHQWNVVEAVSQIRKEGFNIRLELIGAAQYPLAVKKLQLAIEKFDPNGEFISIRGPIKHDYIHEEYTNADIGIFASTCETFGQILIEKMSSGLPIACSNVSAMSELLKGNGVYFDPLKPKSIENALKKIIKSEKLRTDNALKSFEIAKKYSWPKCSNDTFSFLRSCVNE